MAGLSTLSIAVLAAGIALFIIILAIFIAWKVRCEGKPASSPPADRHRAAPTRQHGSPMAPMQIATRASALSATSTDSNGAYYMDNADSGIEPSHTAGQTDDTARAGAAGAYYSELLAADNDAEAKTSTFNSPRSERSLNCYDNGDLQNSTLAVPSAPPQQHAPEGETKLEIKSATTAGVYSTAHENQTETSDGSMNWKDLYDTAGSVSFPEPPALSEATSGQEEGEQVSSVYNLAGPVAGYNTVTFDARERREEGGVTNPNTGDYFELERLSEAEDGRPLSGSSLSENRTSYELQKPVDAEYDMARNIAANENGVYVELEDEH